MPAITGLPAATALTGAEVLAVDQSGITAKATTAAIAALSTSGPATVTALAIVAGVVTIDWSLGDYFTLALSANVTSIAVINLPAVGKAGSIMIRITQDPTTAHTFAMPGSFRWDSSGVGVVSSALGAVGVLALTTFDQGTKFDATLSMPRI